MRIVATVTAAALLALSGVALAGVDASVNIGISTPAPAVSVHVGSPTPPPVVIIEKKDNGKHLGHFKKGKKKHGKKKD